MTWIYFCYIWICSSQTFTIFTIVLLTSMQMLLRVKTFSILPSSTTMLKAEWQPNSCLLKNENISMTCLIALKSCSYSCDQITPTIKQTEQWKTTKVHILISPDSLAHQLEHHEYHDDPLSGIELKLWHGTKISSTKSNMLTFDLHHCLGKIS